MLRLIGSRILPIGAGRLLPYAVGIRFESSKASKANWKASHKPIKPAVSRTTRSAPPKSDREIEDEEDKKIMEKAAKTGSRIRRWGAITSTHSWNRKATKYYVAMYVAFLFYGFYYFKKMYAYDNERKALIEKRDSEDGQLTEWERLRIRELSGDLIRTKDVEKLNAYHQLREEYEKKWKSCKTKEDRELLGKFNPQPEDIEPIIDRRLDRSVLPARDLSKFYDGVAESYDKEVGREEMMMGMKSKRKWLMKHCKGDVLEVASGTGRNIPLLDPSKVTSYTFLDPSEKMMEEAFEKFKEEWPNFSKVKFVVGRAEDLIKMTGSEEIKYDTIIETFGLCSEEDPIQALKNMKELLKPGGRIVLLEHGRGSYGFVNKKLDDGAQRHSDKWGCRWNLDIGELVDEAGLEITREKRAHMGTTWTVVCKRPGDVMEYEELGFYDKYLSRVKGNVDSSKAKERTGKASEGTV
ncbi:DEKNAAC101558 [Brettanomyces naardenensis]|uniref:DEKNAAC101558 n=1 Tax=Brettanomyces naardenensis TaxID=13370 RepID=A0A448YIA4_BRENA|nr:DEKNAAC101558 [Brettanomyces naardenensis]